MGLYFFPQGNRNKPAKLYKRYTYTKDIPALAQSMVDGHVVYRPQDTAIIELNNYTNYQTFRWAFETEVQDQMGTQSRGLVTNTKYVSIKTNARYEIQPGDIVQLSSAVFHGKKFFVVTEVQQQWAHIPKLVQTYQVLQLTSLL